MSDLKKQLHGACVAFVQKRMSEAQHAINEASQASTDDTKSSAGDKYETGREMMQQEMDRNMAQLNEANKLMVALNRISVSGTSTAADAGSVVFTDNGKFYLAISAGTLVIDRETYFAVSPASPIGLKLKCLQTGDSFSLNGKTYNIIEVK